MARQFTQETGERISAEANADPRVVTHDRPDHDQMAFGGTILGKMRVVHPTVHRTKYELAVAEDDLICAGDNTARATSEPRQRRGRRSREMRRSASVSPDRA